MSKWNTTGSILIACEPTSTTSKEYDYLQDVKSINCMENISLSESVKQESKIVVVVDPFSTGAVLADELIKQGYAVICVYSNKLENIEHITNLVPAGMELNFAAIIGFQNTLEETVEYVKATAAKIASQESLSSPMLTKQSGKDSCINQDNLIAAVMPGAECGVALADKLQNALKMTGNNFSQTNARRNKYLMGETLRKAGLRAVKQFQTNSWVEAKKFISERIADSKNDDNFEVVLKPLESAGTEDVMLCTTMEEAQSAFQKILGKINGLGITNNAVLLQEYLSGDEYVVDIVSRNGKHKVVAIWKYDKRRVNNAAFVYFGVKIVPAYGEVVSKIIEYQLQVLDALGIRNGPSHGEVKFCNGSPVLVEVGSRCHGGEGIWVPIANRCVGYNQVNAAINSILNPHAFNQLPERPTQLLAHGCEAMLVSYEDGILESMPGLIEIEKLRSFIGKEIFIKPGEVLKKTIDMFTTPGSIILMHDDEDILRDDLQTIRSLEIKGLYSTKSSQI